MVRVVLFGNTGLANGVFRSLIAHESIELCAVYTRKLPGDFPYYNEKELWQLSEQNNIPTFFGLNVNSEHVIDNLYNLKPDYIIVSSFDQIVKETVINIARYGIVNFHPSLLPQYRGPNPISWVLINGEKMTGLTIHRLTKGIDSGDILYQETLEVEESDNLGSLYNKLSILAELQSKKLVIDIASNGLPVGKPQEEKNMSYYAKSTNFKYIDLSVSAENILNRIRAFQPFPKPILKIDDSDYLIVDVAFKDVRLDQEVGFSKDSDMFYFKNDEVLMEFVISQIS